VGALTSSTCWWSRVRNRRRGLSIKVIRDLHDKLGIPAEVLIRPSRPAPEA
jgi:HTH-type transcriptional regulator/antitoxin HigA